VKVKVRGAGNGKLHDLDNAPLSHQSQFLKWLTATEPIAIGRESSRFPSENRLNGPLRSPSRGEGSHRGFIHMY